jgi:dihydropteroate synthase
MGVINCSPESFYAGSYTAAPDIHTRAATMHNQGADLIDIGARSTAPAAPPLSVGEEADRIDAALRELDGSGFTVSVDTMHPEVLKVCLRHEIHAINDIAGLADPAFAALAADSGLPVVAMASFSRPGDAVGFDATMQALWTVQERCVRYRIDEYVLDPGVGRWIPERSSEDDWELCRRLDEFLALDRPLLAAVSRKTFIGDLLGRPAQDRLAGTLAVTLMLVERGAAVVRCHDVQETADILKVYRKMVKA